jgi:hypothetical protein
MNKILIPCFSLVLLVIFSVSHAGEKSDILTKENQMATRAIKEIIKEHARELMAIPGVVGAGQGLCEGKPCIKVFVIKKTPEIVKRIPDILDSYPVIIEETGPIKALPQK